MIRLVGIEGTAEFRAGEKIRDFFESQWPGITETPEEKDLVVSEAKEINDVEDVVASILLVEDLRIQKE